MTVKVQLYPFDEHLFEKITFEDGSAKATLDCKPINPNSYDSLQQKFINSLLERLKRGPLGHREILNYYVKALPELAKTEDERALARYLSSSKSYETDAHMIIAELELAGRITSRPGIVDGKPMRMYKLAQRRNSSCS
jgi:hypothetical protein